MSIPKVIRVVTVGPHAFEPHYLTCGKTYAVVEDASPFPNTQRAVNVQDDEGDIDYIRLTGWCAHGYTYEVVE